MSFIFNKNKLNEHQIDKLGSLGQRLGQKIYRSRPFRIWYIYTKRFGNRYPAVIVTLFMTLCCLSLGINIYNLSRNSPSETSVGLNLSSPKLHSNYDDSIRFIRRGIDQVFIDARIISDSIQAILQKPNLTHEDSVYVVVKGKYLERLTNSIQKTQ